MCSLCCIIYSRSKRSSYGDEVKDLTKVHSERSKVMMNELRLHSKRLERLSVTTKSLHTVVKREFYTTQKLISEENKLVVERVESEIRGLSHKLPNESAIVSHLRQHGADIVPIDAETHNYLPSYDEATRASQMLVSCKFLAVQLPLGLLTVRKTSTEAWHGSNGGVDRGTQNLRSRLEFTLFPASWLSRTVIQIYFRWKRPAGSDAPDVNFGLKQRHYNQNPSLVRLLNLGDIRGIQAMLLRSEASPHDLLAPWGNTLLHVSHTSMLYDRRSNANNSRSQ
jgi:hypothetical protein